VVVVVLGGLDWLGYILGVVVVVVVGA